MKVRLLTLEYGSYNELVENIEKLEDKYGWNRWNKIDVIRLLIGSSSFDQIMFDSEGKFTDIELLSENIWKHNNIPDVGRIDISYIPASPNKITDVRLSSDSDPRAARFELTEPQNIDNALKVYIDPGSSSAEEVAEVMLAMSDLNRALGGNGLEFESTGRSVVMKEA